MVQLTEMLPKKHLYEKKTQPNCAWLSVLGMGQRSLRTGYPFTPERACLYQDSRWAVQDPAYCCGTLSTEMLAAGAEGPEVLLGHTHWTGLQKMLNEEKPH